MTETIKFIIGELAKEPFRKKFTVISFDSLNPETLLQILNDVLAEIEPSNKMDIREEAVEDTVVRMFNMLRVLKYKPSNPDPTVLRSGLAAGDKDIIHPMLEWLLPRVGELRTRAYLAAFLVKVEIPPEFRSELEVEGLYQQYEGSIEQFKAIHKQLETMKGQGFTTSEIRKDIEAMEAEQESVGRKIEKLKRNTDQVANRDDLLGVIRAFRKEREHGRELGTQSVSQSQAQQLAEQKVVRLQRQLKEVKNATIGATPEGTLQRLEQDKELTSFIVREKLPKELTVVRKQVDAYNKIVYDNMDDHDLEDRRVEVEALKTHVNELVKRKMMKTEDDNLVLFRQQTSIVANKKLGLIAKLDEMKADLGNLRQEIGAKQDTLEKLTGDVKMNEDQFKEYVRVLRIKSTRYKQLKSQMDLLVAEIGILSRTQAILNEDLKQSEVSLKATESRLGVQGFSQAQNTLEKVTEEKSVLEEHKTKNLQEMAVSVEELHKRIASKKNELGPIVKTLNAKRQQVQVLTHEYEGLRKKYEGVANSAESGMGRLTKEVESQRKRYEQDQLRLCKLNVGIDKFSVELERARNELKMYAATAARGGGAGPAAGARSYKDQLLAKISEQERTGVQYKDEEKQLGHLQVDRVQQTQMWSDVQKLLECKCALMRRKAATSGRSGAGTAARRSTGSLYSGDGRG